MDFTHEIFFRTARSGGSGGQNVNKVETMVEAWWYIAGSRCFTSEEKELIAARLEARINKDGFLLVRNSETRSQLENKSLARNRMVSLVEQSLVVPKRRKATRPSRTAIQRRLDEKARNSEKKNLRRGGWY